MTNGLSAAAVRPLDTLDPAAPLGDLGWLDDAVGDALVVAVGEASHYNDEFLRLRHRLLRHLVERHGFSVCAVESGYPESALVDDWVRGGPGDLDDVLARGFTSLMGLWQPVRAQLEWLRAHNRDAAEPVGYRGIDLPGSMVSLLPGLDAVLGYLAVADPGFAADSRAREIAAGVAADSAFSATAMAQRYQALPADTRDELTAGVAALGERLTARRDEYLARTSAAEYARAVRTVRMTAVLESFVRAMVRGDTEEMADGRDAAMAEVVSELVADGERVVLAAHNMHVQRTRADVPMLGWMYPLGAHLAERLGRGYVVLGTTSGPGQSLNAGEDFYAGTLFGTFGAPEPDSLDGVLAASHDGPFGVDLRTLPDADAAVLRGVSRQRAGLHGYSQVAPMDAFDALVHVPTVSAAEPDAGALDHAPAEVQAAFATWRAGSAAELGDDVAVRGQHAQ